MNKQQKQNSMIRKLALVTAVSAVMFTAACSESKEAKAPGAGAAHGEGIGAGGVAGDNNTAPPQPCGGDKTSATWTAGALPQPGQMPDTGTLSIIQKRGFLVAGIDLNTELFGYDPKHLNDPTQYQGFDIDIARQIARAIFGDPNKIEFRVVTLSDAKGATPANGSGEVSQLNRGGSTDGVDVVVRTTTITCRRIESANFSNPYYVAQQRLLVPIGATVGGRPVTGIDDFKGQDKKVCASAGSTSLDNIKAHLGAAAAVGATNSLDCLALLQEDQVDAVSTDDALLRGMVAQDPKVQIVGDSLQPQPYGIVTALKSTDLAAFVNSVLAQMESDGTWARLYEADLTPGTAAPSPPAVPASYPLG
jgi:polar amino acid transport system substrate-binding protein